MDLSCAIRSNLERAMEAVASARAAAGLSDGPGAVSVMAVTKNHPPYVVLAAVEAGIRLVGENRVSEGGRKIAAVGRDRAEFHLIGPLHRGEVRQAVRDFHWIDSVAGAGIVAEIARRSAGRIAPGILLEVNTSGEPSKHGFAPDAGELEKVVIECRSSGLEPAGLLTVGPLAVGERASRSAFALLRSIRDEVGARTGLPLRELSMGMSDDVIWAVMEGATTVRLGRFLLGERPGP